MKGRHLIGSVLLCALLGLLVGCAHYRVQTPRPNPGTELKKKQVDVYLWGLLEEKVVADNCLSNGIDEVGFSSNLGNDLISILTLDIWMPREVEWKCAKPPMQPGTM